MKDMKFVIIILLMFFGLEIMAQINDYDYNVNKTGIMYQENNNIALNENNRFYDYDIDFDLNESYLHYSPVKKGGLLDSLYNDKSKNLARPNLTGKHYFGDGVYRLYNVSGITIDYDIYSGYYIFNGSNDSNPTTFIPLGFSTYVDSSLVFSIVDVSGAVSINQRPIFSYSLNNSVSETFTFYPGRSPINIDTLNGDFVFGIRRISGVSGITYDNFKFKLQIEKGTEATPYTVPYIPALQIAFNGTNQVEYINPFVEQIIEINDINNVNNIDFELLNTKNPVVFNWSITTNPNIPFVRFYNNQTKLLYDFTDVKEMNNIGNTLVGSRSNILNGFDFALDLVNTFYEGFQKLFNTKLIENIRDALSRVWPLLPPKWPWTI